MISFRKMRFVIKTLAVFLLPLLTHLPVFSLDTSDSLLIVFKNELLRKKTYDHQKEVRISKIKNAIVSCPENDLKALYNLNLSLCNEYSTYQRDSALTYAQRLLQIATKITDTSKINNARLKLGQVLISAGMFKEAFDCLNIKSIPTENMQMKGEHYSLMVWLYWSMADYNNDKIYSPYYLQKHREYNDSISLHAVPDPFELDLAIRFSDTTKANQLKNYRYYIHYLSKDSKDPHKTARTAYRLSTYFSGQEKIDLLLIAAINDIRSSTKETLAIIKLGEEFYKRGDMKNADMALQQAMEEAVFYGARSRKVEISSILPYVTAEKMLQSERYIIAGILLSVILASITIGIWYSRKRLKLLNKKIQTQNSDMQKALSALEQSQQENTRIMKIVAHDLRSPMAATISIASMLLEGDNLLPEDKEMLELMKTSSIHSLEMISDLLNMNTTAEGLKKGPVEMHTLLRYCVDLLKLKANDKKQEITLKTQEIVATVNREKIWRVISNLIVNAIKFSPEGSVIGVEMHQEQNAVLIAIKDNGIGIPENLKDKIFQMFTDARRAGTSGEQSFGLGLAISRQIVEAHGGQIWFHSLTGDGTTFYVELPKV